MAKEDMSQSEWAETVQNLSVSGERDLEVLLRHHGNLEDENRVLTLEEEHKLRDALDVMREVIRRRVELSSKRHD